MNKTKFQKLALVIFIALICGILLNTPAFAAEDTIYQKITSDQLIKIIESTGDTAEDKAENVVLWSSNDSNGSSAFLISEDQTLVIFFFQDRDIKLTPEKVNKWNSEKGFSKAYIDDDGNTILSLDFSLKSGVTEANIKSFIKLCGASSRAFLREMK
jgi:hypothetical protein